jgi:hypothetical protein
MPGDLITTPADTLSSQLDTVLQPACGTQPGLAMLAANHPLADSRRHPLHSSCCCLQGWEYGVASDTDPEWHWRAAQLRAYHRQHGDTSVGFRDGDDPELAR